MANLYEWGPRWQKPNVGPTFSYRASDDLSLRPFSLRIIHEIESIGSGFPRKTGITRKIWASKDAVPGPTATLRPGLSSRALSISATASLTSGVPANMCNTVPHEEITIGP